MAVFGVFFMSERDVDGAMGARETADARRGDGETDARFMREALALARRGLGSTRPNPMVGAVIVREGEIIGRGWHERYGGPHAEVNAIADARNRGDADFSGTTIYVTLEPCAHFGKTPPCADLVVATGIGRVVCGMVDPNPLVAGRGIDILRRAGVSASVGILERECRELNRGFVKRVTAALPYVTLKSAVSLDGKIATSTGESKWITGEAARADAHLLRAECSAILTGIGTVLADDPLLTPRGSVHPALPPARVVADTKLRIPLSARLVATANEGPVIVAVGSETLAKASREASDKKRELETSGVRVVSVPERAGRIDLKELAILLAKEGLDSVLIEAGGTLAWAALEAGIVDRVRYYVAPVILGGNGLSAAAGTGARTIADAPRLSAIRTRMAGDDLVVEGDLCSPA
jgi:diaminohydroxyphosphoribosylaminopyrimidine deaminase/5-amino-6-(5-phosphoribosylamino)uracil reductase